jgi:hypothetical protein
MRGPSARAPKSRTPTTSHEQFILSSYIHRFFHAPDRSEERADIVRLALTALDSTNRKWTARLVRLWFNNNRKQYIRPATENALVGVPVAPLGWPRAQPMSVPYACVPMPRIPVESPIYFGGAIPLLPIPIPPMTARSGRATLEDTRAPARTIVLLPRIEHQQPRWVPQPYFAGTGLR